MRYQKILMMASLLLAAATLWAGEITGTVTWEGKAPKMRPLSMDADPVCAGQHKGTPALSEILVLGEGQTMANIFVRVWPSTKQNPPIGIYYFQGDILIQIL